MEKYAQHHPFSRPPRISQSIRPVSSRRITPTLALSTPHMSMVAVIASTVALHQTPSVSNHAMTPAQLSSVTPAPLQPNNETPNLTKTSHLPSAVSTLGFCVRFTSFCGALGALPGAVLGSSTRSRSLDGIVVGLIFGFFFGLGCGGVVCLIVDVLCSLYYSLLFLMERRSGMHVQHDGERELGSYLPEKRFQGVRTW